MKIKKESKGEIQFHIQKYTNYVKSSGNLLANNSTVSGFKSISIKLST